MGNCETSFDSIPCERIVTSPEAWGESPVEIDPDIAGPGIVIAFFLVACLTCVSIICGYLTHSLPQDLLTEFDDSLVARYQPSILSQRILPLLRRCFQGGLSTPRRTGVGPPENRQRISREQRVSAFTKFVLGLSDQQLATGLAILIAALANLRCLTDTDLRIVYYLAWFSATTQVASLKVLRAYFYENHVARFVRVLGTTVFVAQISACKVILARLRPPSSRSIPLQCYFPALAQPSPNSYGTGIQRDLDPVALFSVFLFLIPVSVYLMFALYKNPLSIRARRQTICTIPLLRPALPSWPMAKTKKRILFENANLQQQAMFQQGILLPRESHRYAGYAQLYLLTLRRYRMSLFYFTLNVVLIGMVYGICHSSMGVKPSTEYPYNMSFGQVVAIAMLVVPIMNAFEIYDETRNTRGTVRTQRSIEGEGLPRKSREFPPRVSERELLISIRRHLQQHTARHNLDQQRIAFISLALSRYMISQTHDRHNRNNQCRDSVYSILRSDARFPFRWLIRVSIFVSFAMKIFVAILVSQLTEAEWGLYTIMPLMPWLVLIGLDKFLETLLLKGLVTAQVQLMEEMPGQADWVEVFENRTGAASLTGVIANHGVSNETGEAGAEIELEPLRRVDTEADVAVIVPPGGLRERSGTW